MVAFFIILGISVHFVRLIHPSIFECSYEENKLKKFVLPLLVLSHCYLVPQLKRVCVYILEHGWLTKENVIDVLQLARNCDAPRLSFICVRMVVQDFKSVSSTEGWKVMKRANPALEQELVESMVEEDSVSQFLFLVCLNLYWIISLVNHQDLGYSKSSEMTWCVCFSLSVHASWNFCFI